MIKQPDGGPVNATYCNRLGYADYCGISRRAAFVDAWMAQNCMSRGEFFDRDPCSYCTREYAIEHSTDYPNYVDSVAANAHEIFYAILAHETKEEDKSNDTTS